MPISLLALKTAVVPSKTVLVLGAGASVSSGAPTGSELAERLWRQVAECEPQSRDLTETASILALSHSRRTVVDVVIAALQRLQPAGALLALPKFDWKTVFTTNFDRLIELAYQRFGQPLAVIRSNYDFTQREAVAGTRLYKMHGCITQDETLGHKASMILTESDYETHAAYRQAMIAGFQSALMESNVLIIGQSLKDRDLQSLLNTVLAAKLEGAPGHVYLLLYEHDHLRAPLFEAKGIRVAFGDIDQFISALAEDFREPEHLAAPAAADELPLALVTTVLDVASARLMGPNVARMFNGGPATYADIVAGATFDRSDQATAISKLISGGSLLATMTGAAGVGKTTLARKILLDLSERGICAWEHKTDFSFQHRAWTSVDAQLREAGKIGVLLLDECTHYLRETNALVDHLASMERPALRLVLTANLAQWAPRMKSPNIFAKGSIIELSQLKEVEINSLLNLAEYNADIAALVYTEFKQMRRVKQYEVLKQKSSADMFVCLKNIFANESLDTILLKEYQDLNAALQEYYRYVAALEAVGTRVHRQLLVRMLRTDPGKIKSVLDGLSGIVDEYDINPKDGIYGWSTRHIVIARRIADYKFSSLEELEKLFDTIIDHINPSQSIELQSIRAICDSEFGIGRLGDSKARRRLYKRLIDVAPGERIPWHRLIRELLDEGALDDTEYLIRSAEEAVGADAPIDRYKVKLLAVRADKTEGISDGDRVALLRKAYETAMRNVERHKWDKFSYRMLCDVAVQLLKRTGNHHVLNEAILITREAANRILDPEMLQRIQHYEDIGVRIR